MEEEDEFTPNTFINPQTINISKDKIPHLKGEKPRSQVCLKHFISENKKDYRILKGMRG